MSEVRIFMPNVKRERHEPTIAPGMNMQDDLEERAEEQEVDAGNYTSVTKLYLDRTPED
jgi:hypothetical protein